MKKANDDLDTIKSIIKLAEKENRGFTKAESYAIDLCLWRLDKFYKGRMAERLEQIQAKLKHK